MQSPLTRTGALVGTPAYMAPEQMLSDFVDHRSDQFSFCVALWQAVYGVRPFAGESVTAILESTLKGKLAEPTRAPRLPRRVRDALLRGLSAEPEDRFPSIEALLAELAPPARRPWLIAGGVAAIAAAAVATAIAVSRPERAAVPATAICTGSERELADVWSDASHARLANAVAAAKLPRPDETTAALTSALDRYAAQWSAMHVDNCEATRVRKQQTDDIMAKRLACLDRRRVELRLAAALALAIHDVESMKLAQGQIAALPQIEMCTVARMDEELIAPTNETADALVAIQRTRLTEADFYASQRKLDQAEAIAHTVIEEARKIPYPPLEAEGLIKLGQIQMYGLRWDEAATSMTEAVQVADLARHHRAKGEAQLALIQILRRLGRTEEAERYRRYAQNSLASAGSIDQSEIDLARSLAQTFLHQGAVEEAIGQHRRILELTESLHGKDSVEVAKVAAEMAAVLMNAAERYADAVPLLERATAIYDNQPGMGKLEGLTTRFQRQVALHFTGRFADAVAAGQDVIARAGADSLWASAVWSFTGMSQIELGQVEEAHASARRALALTEKQLGKESVSYANTYMLEAQLYARVEDYASAERVMREARTMIVPLVPADDPQLATVNNAIASMMAKQGRAAGAIVMFEATLAALARQADPNVPDIARTYSRLATALLAANQPQRAVNAANQALERWHNNLAPPGEIASAKFTLARGLWLSNRNRPRALVLAQEARALYADTIEEPRRVEIERWLADKRR